MAADRKLDSFELPVSSEEEDGPGKSKSGGKGGRARSSVGRGLPAALVDPTLRKLYLVSALHGFSDACAKLSTPGFVMEMFGTDFVAASAFFAMVNSGQSIAEFLLNPLLGSLSDRFGRKAFLMMWPPVNTVSRILVTIYPTSTVILAQQILVKMLEYTFEKAIAASVSDVVQGDRRSVVSGNVSMLKIGVGFLAVSKKRHENAVF